MVWCRISYFSCYQAPNIRDLSQTSRIVRAGPPSRQTKRLGIIQSTGEGWPTAELLAAPLSLRGERMCGTHVWGTRMGTARLTLALAADLHKSLWSPLILYYKRWIPPANMPFSVVRRDPG